jgi:FkbM family methyltransferase
MLFLMQPIRGFRRLDFLFVNKVLDNRRLTFSCRILGIEFKMVSNPNDDLFSLLRSKTVHTWEPGSLKLWATICQRSSAVVDIGAYSGIYSIAAQKLGVKTVFSVEPNPNSRQRLEKNFSLNHINSYRLFSSPLGDVTGLKLGLYVPGSNSSMSGKRLESSGARYLESENAEVIIDGERWFKIDVQESSRLDDLIGVQTQIDAIKIDAEGMEIEVLKGGSEILRLYQPELIIETWSSENTDELNKLLSSYGYSKGIIIDDGNFNKYASNLYFVAKSNLALGISDEN